MASTQKRRALKAAVAAAAKQRLVPQVNLTPDQHNAPPGVGNLLTNLSGVPGALSAAGKGITSAAAAVPVQPLASGDNGGRVMLSGAPATAATWMHRMIDPWSPWTPSEAPSGALGGAGSDVLKGSDSTPEPRMRPSMAAVPTAPLASRPPGGGVVSDIVNAIGGAASGVRGALSGRPTGTLTPTGGGKLSFSSGGTLRGSTDRAVTSLNNLVSLSGLPITVLNGASANRGGDHSNVGQDHQAGMAFDINIAGMSDAQKLTVYSAAKQAGFNTFGFGLNDIHVGIRSSPTAWSYYGGPTVHGKTGASYVHIGPETKATWAGVRLVDLKNDAIANPGKATYAMLKPGKAPAGPAPTPEQLATRAVELTKVGESPVGPPKAPLTSTGPINPDAMPLVLADRRGTSGYRAANPNATKVIQQALNKVAGANLKVDGINGPDTQAALKTYQENKGLKVDGKTGPQTWHAFATDMEVPVHPPAGLYPTAQVPTGMVPPNQPAKPLTSTAATPVVHPPASVTAAIPVAAQPPAPVITSPAVHPPASVAAAAPPSLTAIPGARGAGSTAALPVNLPNGESAAANPQLGNAATSGPSLAAIRVLAPAMGARPPATSPAASTGPSMARPGNAPALVSGVRPATPPGPPIASIVQPPTGGAPPVPPQLGPPRQAIEALRAILSGDKTGAAAPQPAPDVPLPPSRPAAAIPTPPPRPTTAGTPPPSLSSIPRGVDMSGTTGARPSFNMRPFNAINNPELPGSQPAAAANRFMAGSVAPPPSLSSTPSIQNIGLASRTPSTQISGGVRPSSLQNMGSVGTTPSPSTRSIQTAISGTTPSSSQGGVTSVRPSVTVTQRTQTGLRTTVVQNQGSGATGDQLRDQAFSSTTSIPQMSGFPG